jgi:membrane protease YdiL (CAAX protease family)
MAARKNGKQSYTTSQLLNYARDSYLERTSRPVYAIIFLLPFIVFYELGTSLINTDVLSQYQVRVVAFVWLQDFLERLGMGNRLAWIAPPLVVIVILAGLQVASRKQWYFCLRDYAPMVFECICLAVPLIVLSLLFNSPAVRPDNHRPPLVIDPSAGSVVGLQQAAPVGQGPEFPEPAPDPAARNHSLVANIVTGVGAGIYEELVFRLILICVLMVLFQDVVGLSHQNAVVLSIMVSAALFSAHHYDFVWVDGRLGLNGVFNWTEFGFRTIAGVYFAILFALRGFGITAGTHAFYDIIAIVVNAAFFSR